MRKTVKMSSRSSFFVRVPGMALILLMKVQPQVFIAKCSEPQVVSNNAMDEGRDVANSMSLRTET